MSLFPAIYIATPTLETENNAYVKFWSDQQRVLWYVMAFSFDPVQKLSLNVVSGVRLAR